MSRVIEKSKTVSGGGSAGGFLSGGFAQGSGSVSSSSKTTSSSGSGSKVEAEAASKDDALNTYLEWKGGSSNSDVASWRESLGLGRSSNWKVIERFETGCFGHWHWVENTTLASKLCKKWMQLRTQNATDTASSQFCTSLVGPTSCRAGKYIDLASKACKQCPSNTYQTEYRFVGSGCTSCQEAARKCKPGKYLSGCGGALEGNCDNDCTPPASDVDVYTPKGMEGWGWISNGGFDKDKCRFHGFIANRGQSCNGQTELMDNRGKTVTFYGTGNHQRCLDACIAKDDCDGVQWHGGSGLCALLRLVKGKLFGVQDDRFKHDCWIRRRE